MRSPRERFTVWRMMIVVGAAAVGLAIAPAGYSFVAVFTPFAAGYVLLNPNALVGAALFVLGLSALLEFLFRFPVPLWVYLPVTIALEGALWQRRCPPDQARPYKKIVAVGAVIAGLYLVPWTPRKPFLRALGSVRSGMSMVDVRRVMAGYLESTRTGWRITGDTVQEPVVGGHVSFRHSDDPDFNADIATVSFANGRVTHVGFSPD
jgi:hypothetical protein